MIPARWIKSSSRGETDTRLAREAGGRANLVLTDGNTVLGDEELEMLVILRMNRKFTSWSLQYAH